MCESQRFVLLALLVAGLCVLARAGEDLELRKVEVSLWNSRPAFSALADTASRLRHDCVRTEELEVAVLGTAPVAACGAPPPACLTSLPHPAGD